MAAICAVLIIGWIVRALTTHEFDWVTFGTADGTVGVSIENQCASVVRAKAGETAADALQRLAEAGVEIPRGRQVEVSLIENAAVEVQSYVLAYEIGRGEPVVKTFDLERIRNHTVVITVQPDCLSASER